VCIGINIETSKEAFGKAKSWELRFYRKARPNASKKTRRLTNRGFQGWIAHRGETMAKARIPRGKAGIVSAIALRSRRGDRFA